MIYKALGGAARPALGNGEGGEEGAEETLQTWRRVEGKQHVQEVVLVDQSPIGRTPRSNPVTYIKAFDLIRDLFAHMAAHGISAAEAEAHLAQWAEEDFYMPLPDELALIADAGFPRPDVFWRDGMIAVYGAVNGGGPDFEIRTFNGNVYVRKGK